MLGHLTPATAYANLDSGEPSTPTEILRGKSGRALRAPLRASDEQLAGLPPAFVIVDEADVLRDEGEAYAARLRSAGVEVTTVRYDGITDGSDP